MKEDWLKIHFAGGINQWVMSLLIFCISIAYRQFFLGKYMEFVNFGKKALIYPGIFPAVLI